MADELVHGILRHDLLKDLPTIDWNQSTEHFLESVDAFVHAVHGRISQETDRLVWRNHMLEKEKEELVGRHDEVEKDQLRQIKELKRKVRADRKSFLERRRIRLPTQLGARDPLVDPKSPVRRAFVREKSTQTTEEDMMKSDVIAQDPKTTKSMKKATRSKAGSHMSSLSPSSVMRVTIRGKKTPPSISERTTIKPYESKIAPHEVTFDEFVDSRNRDARMKCSTPPKPISKRRVLDALDASIRSSGVEDSHGVDDDGDDHSGHSFRDQVEKAVSAALSGPGVDHEDEFAPKHHGPSLNENELSHSQLIFERNFWRQHHDAVVLELQERRKRDDSVESRLAELRILRELNSKLADDLSLALDEVDILEAENHKIRTSLDHSMHVSQEYQELLLQFTGNEDDLLSMIDESSVDENLTKRQQRFQQMGGMGDSQSNASSFLEILRSQSHFSGESDTKGRRESIEFDTAGESRSAVVMSEVHREPGKQRKGDGVVVVGEKEEEKDDECEEERECKVSRSCESGGLMGEKEAQHEEIITNPSEQIATYSAFETSSPGGSEQDSPSADHDSYVSGCEKEGETLGAADTSSESQSVRFSDDTKTTSSSSSSSLATASSMGRKRKISLFGAYQRTPSMRNVFHSSSPPPSLLPSMSSPKETTTPSSVTSEVFESIYGGSTYSPRSSRPRGSLASGRFIRQGSFSFHENPLHTKEKNVLRDDGDDDGDDVDEMDRQEREEEEREEEKGGIDLGSERVKRQRRIDKYSALVDEGAQTEALVSPIIESEDAISARLRILEEERDAALEMLINRENETGLSVIEDVSTPRSPLNRSDLFALRKSLVPRDDEMNACVLKIREITKEERPDWMAYLMQDLSRRYPVQADTLRHQWDELRFTVARLQDMHDEKRAEVEVLYAELESVNNDLQKVQLDLEDAEEKSSRFQEQEKSTAMQLRTALGRIDHLERVRRTDNPRDLVGMAVRTLHLGLGIDERNLATKLESERKRTRQLTKDVEVYIAEVKFLKAENEALRQQVHQGKLQRMPSKVERLKHRAAILRDQSRKMMRIQSTVHALSPALHLEERDSRREGARRSLISTLDSRVGGEDFLTELSLRSMGGIDLDDTEDANEDEEEDYDDDDEEEEDEEDAEDIEDRNGDQQKGKEKRKEKEKEK
eukprot:TRINITY_DN432_c2_g1_i3.p1 TRINITY_DN432_c2_g1~~TRINITY_DN432_c2_g1_i3.p1  ORF type:complete len:1187 (-),score=415.98 TRINITY_DN432_c2_g1_i3:157-3642(-)